MELNEAEKILNQNGYLIEKNYGINTPVWKPATDALYNALKKYKNYGIQVRLNCNRVKFGDGNIVYDDSTKKYICTDGNGEVENCDTIEEVLDYIWDNEWAWI